MFDLSALVPTYIAAIPTDPQGASTTLTFLDKIIPTAEAHTGGSGYQVMQDSTGKVVLNAPMAELGTQIAIGSTTNSQVVVADTCDSICLGMRANLVAHYKMNDANCTTVVDSSGNGHNGSGTCTSGSSRVGSGSLSFNGTSNYFTVPASWEPGTSDFTISWWENKTTTGGWTINHDDNLFSGFLLGQGSNALYMSASSGWGIASGRSMGSESLNSWNFMMVTRSGNTFTTYKNNLQQDTWSNSGSIRSGTSYMLQIAKGQSTVFFGGMVDDLRVYSKALSSQERGSLAAGTEAE